VLSRPFLTLALAMFTAMMGIGMVTPILPVYAKAQGASGPEIGLAFSSFAIVQLFVSPLSGRLADRYGRKLFIVAGLASYVVTAGGWYYTDTVFWTIAFRAFSGIGSALIFSLSQAYVGDLAPEGREGRYMGVFGIFIASGFGVGPLLAGIIRDLYDIETVFSSMAVMFAAASITVGILLPKSRRIKRGDADGLPTVPWSTILRHPYVQGLYLVGTSLSFAMGASFTFVAIFLERELNATATMVGAVLAVQQVTNGAMQPISGMLADRFNRRLLIIGGAILVAAGYLTPAIVDEYWVIVLGFMIGVGVGNSIAQVSMQALQVEIGRGLGMATVMSLQSHSFGSGVLMGSMLTGIVNDMIGTRWVFVAATLVILGGALAFVVRTAGRPITRFVDGEEVATVPEPASG
jgi:DHA1 family multidrug resistance protein-like MFS transporter